MELFDFGNDDIFSDFFDLDGNGVVDEGEATPGFLFEDELIGMIATSRNSLREPHSVTFSIS